MSGERMSERDSPSWEGLCQCAAVSASAHDLRRGHELADVPLRVLGGVEEETEHGRGKSRASHFARIEERARVGGAELGERAVDGRVEVGDERFLDADALLGAAFRLERVKLRSGELL